MVDSAPRGAKLVLGAPQRNTILLTKILHFHLMHYRVIWTVYEKRKFIIVRGVVITYL